MYIHALSYCLLYNLLLELHNHAHKHGIIILYICVRYFKVFYRLICEQWCCIYVGMQVNGLPNHIQSSGNSLQGLQSHQRTCTLSKFGGIFQSNYMYMYITTKQNYFTHLSLRLRVVGPAMYNFHSECLHQHVYSTFEFSALIGLNP